MPFDVNGPFNRPVPANAVVDPASEAMVTYLSRTGRANAALYEFGIPIWEAGAARLLHHGGDQLVLAGEMPVQEVVQSGIRSFDFRSHR